jgi:hypothetical protein
LIFHFNFNSNLNINSRRTSSSSQVNLSWKASHTFDMIDVVWRRLEVEMTCSILFDINSKLIKHRSKMSDRTWNSSSSYSHHSSSTRFYLLSFVCTFYFRFNVIRLHFLYSIWSFHVSTFLWEKSVRIRILFNVAHRCYRLIVKINSNLE